MGWDVSEAWPRAGLAPDLAPSSSASCAEGRGLSRRHQLKLGDVTRFVFHPGDRASSPPSAGAGAGAGSTPARSRDFLAEHARFVGVGSSATGCGHGRAPGWRARSGWPWLRSRLRHRAWRSLKVVPCRRSTCRPGRRGRGRLGELALAAANAPGSAPRRPPKPAPPTTPGLVPPVTRCIRRDPRRGRLASARRSTALGVARLLMLLGPVRR